MKNLFLLPTEKPSRLLKDLVDKTYQFKKEVLYGNRFEVPLSIYITKDEEIKEGDWVFQECLNMPHRLIKADTENVKVLNDLNKCKKIILTTDADLIKEGVQAIDDEFLEWFVDNPSCEYVKVIDKMRIFNVDELRERHRKGLPHLYSEKIAYKIIIPKEELKQDFPMQKLISIMENDEELRPKQETIEEANFKVLGTKTDTFYNGAKWQQEQNKNKYSKEDLIDAFNEGQALNVRGKLIQGEEWFKQLKDK